jgi:hypothetical protein
MKSCVQIPGECLAFISISNDNGMGIGIGDFDGEEYTICGAGYASGQTSQRPAPARRQRKAQEVEFEKCNVSFTENLKIESSEPSYILYPEPRFVIQGEQGAVLPVEAKSSASIIIRFARLTQLAKSELGL